MSAWRGWRHALGLFGRNRRGNVSIIFAFAALPMLLALGSGVDYGLAMKRQGRMNAAADAAALSAVTPNMMKQPAAVAKANAIAFFAAQTSAIAGVSFDPATLYVVVTDSPTASTVKRNVTVSYRAASSNAFAAILQVPTLTIKGTSSSSAAISPNIDFYLMLDTSPSMAIAATPDGIDTMVKLTPKQNGCAFACHESNPASDNLGNDGGIDNYTLAKMYGVTLRIDLVQAAVSKLMDQAMTTSSDTGAAYRMAGYSFDYTTQNIIPFTANLTQAKADAANIQVLTVYNNAGYLTSTFKNNDADTDFGSAFATVNGAMPPPGSGTNAPSDSPQEVLFIVTDGVSDVAVNGNINNRNYTPFGPATNLGIDWCTSIKSRGIRIAVLYTTYNPLPTNAFYNTNIKIPVQPYIAPTAKACASDGLYSEVNTGGDISAAVLALFQTAIASARLTN